MPADYHFGTFLMPAFAGQLSRAGYTLMMYELTQEEVRLHKPAGPYVSGAGGRNHGHRAV